MPRVMIKCPKTFMLVPTGIAMSKSSFDNPTNVLATYTVRCPSCGEKHTWSKSDAVLEVTKSS
jgi:hypothetical protein